MLSSCGSSGHAPRIIVDPATPAAESRENALDLGIGGRLLDPLKTTVVHDQRCMTTWVVRKEDVSGPGRPLSGDRGITAVRRLTERPWRR
jgi:hypothetical protein